MDNKQKPGFLARLLSGKETPSLPERTEPSLEPKTNPEAKAALEQALRSKPDMTETDKRDFLREFAALQNERQAPGFSAAQSTASPQPTPADDPRREAERRQRLGGDTAQGGGNWKDKLRAIGNGIKNLGLGIGAAAVGAHLLYKNSPAFRFAVKGATFPVWAYPVYTWKAAKAVVMGGPGGVGRVYNGVRSGSVGAVLLAKSAVGTTLKIAAAVFLGAVVLRTGTDMAEGRGYGLADNGLNALTTTFNDTVNIFGRASRSVLPAAETAYRTAEGAVVSGVDSIDETVSSGADKATGAKNAVGECIDKAADCGAAIGGTALNVAGDIATGGAKLWGTGYGLSIKHFYTTLPAFVWNTAVCSAFNCTSGAAETVKTPAVEKKAPLQKADSAKVNNLLGKNESGEKPQAVTPPRPGRNAPLPVSDNPLAQLSYKQIGHRTATVCTTAAVDHKHNYFPNMKNPARLEAMNRQYNIVGETTEKMKFDPSSPLSQAVLKDTTGHIVITVPPFNSGKTTADIQTRTQKPGYVPVPPAEIDGVQVPFICRQWPLTDFLKATEGGINPFKVEGKPRNLVSDVLAPQPALQK